MVRSGIRPIRAALALTGVYALLLVAGTGAASAGSPGGSTHYTGQLPDGGDWIADVPSSWNGTLLLYSHGYGPTIAADAPDPVTQAALLQLGYALAGSSYDPTGSWWALGSALTDQFQTLAAVEQKVLPSAPKAVYAVGTSMGGLISALEDQNSNGRLTGALTTCGLVGGALNLNQYQLDGEYAIAQLLAPSQHIQLTGFVDGPKQGFADSSASATALTNAVQAAQATQQGQARLALAFAFLNVSPWGDTIPGTKPPVPGPMPGIYDFPGQEQGQYTDYTSGLFGGPLNPIGFIVTGREQIEAAAGGESAGTVGVNFARVLESSSYYPEVRALYDAAGLSLQSDLQSLAQNANIVPDWHAYRWLQETSVPNGHLQVPELDLHTISDPLIPVQQENWYRALVDRAGSGPLLDQAFVQAQGHCNFTSADIVAGLQALEARVASGSWGTLATAGSLNTAANGPTMTGLGGGNFLPFWPERLTGAMYPFSFGGGLDFFGGRTVHGARGARLLRR